jgi:predicted permease
MVVLNQVVVLFILIIIGYVIKKLNIVEDSMKKDVSELVINVTLPAFIILSMTANFSVEILSNSVKLIGISFFMYFIAIVFGNVYTKLIKLEDDERSIYKFIVAFSNSGFMGYPIINVVLGAQGVFYAAIFNLAFTIMIWTYGVYIIKGKSSEKMSIKNRIKSIFNPALFAVIIGFILFVFQIELPNFIKSTLSLVGGVTTPLSMMLIGFILSEIHLKDIVSGWKIYSLALVRLLIMPGIMFLILTGLGVEGYLLQIPVLIAAMPAAANTAIVSSRYGGNYKLASKGIFITTLLSIITIPIIIKLIS